MNTVFLRALKAENKGKALLAAIHESDAVRHKQLFEVDPASFSAIPGSPFSYWVSARLLRLFQELPTFEAKGRTAKQGLATADDFRFVRAWWEVPPREVGTCWFPFAKGGKYSPFYSDVHLVVIWANDGAEIRNNLNERGGIRSNVWMLRDTSRNYFLRPGLSWSLRTTSGLALRVMPASCIFAHKGPGAFIGEDDPQVLLALLAVTNSRAFSFFVELQLAAADCAARSYEVGLINRIPVPYLAPKDQNDLAVLARRAWSLNRAQDTVENTSHSFILPVLLQRDGSLSERAAVWSGCLHEAHNALDEIKSDINNLCFDLYSFDAADRAMAMRGSVDEIASTEGAEDETNEVGVIP